MTNLAALAERYGYADWATAFADVDIPVLNGLQRQGDVLILPTVAPDELTAAAAQPLADCLALTGENSQNEHRFHGDGWFWSDPAELETTRPGLKLGVIEVPAGGEAYLMHAEHGALGIAPGCYEVRLQTEFFGDDGWWPVGD